MKRLIVAVVGGYALLLWWYAARQILIEAEIAAMHEEVS